MEPISYELGHHVHLRLSLVQQENKSRKWEDQRMADVNATCVFVSCSLLMLSVTIYMSPLLAYKRPLQPLRRLGHIDRITCKLLHQLHLCWSIVRQQKNQQRMEQQWMVVTMYKVKCCFL
jgi:hypothetical protein